MDTRARDLSQRFEQCRGDFPSLERRLEGFPLGYFDGPGGSQVPRQVMEGMTRYYETSNANTHGSFITSRETDLLLESSRQAVATFLNASAFDQISFGANMTTLNFSLSHAIARSLHPGDRILITQLDHEANRGPWLRLRERGVEVLEVRMQSAGLLDYEDLERKLTERTRLVAVGWASNALGTVNDLSRIRKLSREAGARLLVDAVHYAPHFPIDVSSLGPDFLLCSAYKFYGPHIGILYCRENLLDQLDTDRLQTQEARAPHRIETGTLNHSAVAGTRSAIQYLASLGQGEDLRSRIVSGMSDVAEYEHLLALTLYGRLQEMAHVELFGPDFSSRSRAPTLAFRVRGRTPAECAACLGDRALLVWDGDFYAARAVEILGFAQTGGLVRAGMSLYNTLEEVQRLADAIDELG